MAAFQATAKFLTYGNPERGMEGKGRTSYDFAGGRVACIAQALLRRQIPQSSQWQPAASGEAYSLPLPHLCIICCIVSTLQVSHALVLFIRDAMGAQF